MRPRAFPTADNRAERIAVAIEQPRGPIVETLPEQVIAAFSLNPKQLDRFRDRHSPSGAKDDRKDAFVLADSLRTDTPAFRRDNIYDSRWLWELLELAPTPELSACCASHSAAALGA